MQEQKLKYLKNLTLLLVEDDEELLNKMQTILSIFFKDVAIAKNGVDGYNIYLDSKVDMIITDYVMPDMDGYELCKKIRQTDTKIPLVVMSNYSEKDKLLNVIPLSLAQYLVKPIEYSNLIEALEQMVDKLEDNSYTTHYFSTSDKYDSINKVLIKGDEIITLSKSEIILIELFIANKDTIISSSDMEYALTQTGEKSSHAIKTLVYRIRKKLEKDTIVNVPGFGYMYKTK